MNRTDEKTSFGIRRSLLWLVLPALLAAGATALGDPRTWLPTTGTNYWFDPLNWDGQTTVPQPGDDVTISTAGAALLTNSTPGLGSLDLGGILVFSNWNTTLSATTVTVQVGGLMTLPVAFTNNQMSNNIVIVCSNFSIATGGKLDAAGKGYASKSGNGNGPGYGANIGQGWGGGAGHGGHAFKAQAGGAIAYGSVTVPLTPGSSGYGQNAPWSAGGGAIRIEAPGGTVAVNGTITADGETRSSNTGGGSGGSVYIRCRTLTGNGGKLLARGGSVNNVANGHGAGGRIALDYNSAAQAAVSPVPALQISSAPGTGTGKEADVGSLWLPDTYFLSETLTTNLAGQVYGITSWSPVQLTVTNTWVRFAEPGFQLAVAGDVVVNGANARLEIGGNHPVANWGMNMLASTGAAPSITVGGRLMLTNSATLSVFATATNASVLTGAVVNVAGDLILAPNCKVFAHSHYTNGGSAIFRVDNVAIAAGARFDASVAGYAGGGKASEKGYGPGGGDFDPALQYACGGGYGGRGGLNYKLMPGGATYGSAREPADPGSGGGCQVIGFHGGRGGGVIRIEAAGDIALHGTLIADGESITYGGSSGGDYQQGAGAGGAINLSCRSISGTGSLFARGGSTLNASTSGGGGGRIALAYNTAVQDGLPIPTLSISAAPGDIGRKMGDIGTLWMASSRLLTNVVSYTGEMSADGFTSWSVPSLRVTNCWFRLPDVSVTVTGPVIASGTDSSLHRFEGFRIACDTAAASNATLGVIGRNEGPSFTCSALSASNGVIVINAQDSTGGTFTVNGDARLAARSQMATYGGLNAGPSSVVVRVTGTLELDTNAVINPWSHPTNGGSATFIVKSLVVPAGAQVNADGRGYRGGLTALSSGWGTGKGQAYPNQQATGGGYGGRGGGCTGNQPNPGGIAYGSSNAPAEPGSGGGYGFGKSQYSGGWGGGLVAIEADTLNLNGTITANGGNGPENTAGGGSGGGIHIRCGVLSGSGGVIRANGGNKGGDDGGGGGGRIAIWRRQGETNGFACSVARGDTRYPTTGGTNENGTIVWGWLPPKRAGSLLIVQ